jgi:hypothetical protein
MGGDVDLFSNNDSTSAPPPPSPFEDSNIDDYQSSNITTAAVTSIQEVASSPINRALDCPSQPSLNFSSRDSAIVLRASSTPAPDPIQLWAKLYRSIPKPPPHPLLPQAVPCRLWQKTNRIYAKMFNIKLSCSGSAEEISTGSLIKAVKDGWGALRPEELRNPAMGVLMEVDQQIFPTLDRVTRIALMHKGHMLMKVRYDVRPTGLDDSDYSRSTS